jgi:hypothetical protein
MRSLLVSMTFLALVGCGSSDEAPGSATGGSGGADSGGTGGGGGTGGSGTGGSGTGGSGTGGSIAGTGGSGGSGPDAATAGPPDAGTSSPDSAASPDTWESFAKGFFTSFCVSCHDDDKKGVAARDYHQLANVMKEKAEIACGVSSSQAAWAQRGCTGFPPARQFPVGNGPKPTDAERARLVRWIEAGTP